MSVPWLPFSSPRSVAVLLSERCLSHQTSHDASCTEWSQARALPEALRWRESTRYLVRMQRSDNRDRIWAALTRGSPFRLVARGLAVAVVFAASGTLARHTDGRIADCVLAQPLRPRQCQCFRAVQGADSFACEQITMVSPPIATPAMGLANFWVARNSNWRRREKGARETTTLVSMLSATGHIAACTVLSHALCSLHFTRSPLAELLFREETPEIRPPSRISRWIGSVSPFPPRLPGPGLLRCRQPTFSHGRYRWTRPRRARRRR